jgi:hypothetical protein
MNSYISIYTSSNSYFIESAASSLPLLRFKYALAYQRETEAKMHAAVAASEALVRHWFNSISVKVYPSLIRLSVD